MAYPKALNDQYKADKLSGKSSATSFPQWHKEYLAKLEQEQQLALDTTKQAALQEAVEDVAQATQELSKAARALAIYEEEDAKAIAANLKLVRKTVIDRFVKELPLSKVGSATYFQNIKRKKGLIATA